MLRAIIVMIKYHNLLAIYDNCHNNDDRKVFILTTACTPPLRLITTLYTISSAHGPGLFLIV